MGSFVGRKRGDNTLDHLVWSRFDKPPVRWH
jgi:hypothetical protein